jgi:transcriptional regulator of arginine metabolism
MSPEKEARQRTIRALIERNTIRNQAELVALLAAEGVHTTQSTLSRDLAVIGVTRGPGGYEILPPSTTAGDRRMAMRVFRDAVTSVNVSGPMVVIRTAAGYAPALVQEFDSDVFPVCFGAIAGKDTVLAATPSSAAAHQVMKEIRRFMKARR